MKLIEPFFYAQSGIILGYFGLFNGADDRSLILLCLVFLSTGLFLLIYCLPTAGDGNEKPPTMVHNSTMLKKAQKDHDSGVYTSISGT